MAKGAPRDLKGQNKSDILPYTVDDERWKHAEFANKKIMEDHLFRHREDLRIETTEELLAIARRVMSAHLSDDVLGVVLKNGDVMKYIRSENLFAVGTKTGIIKTCMKPKHGEAHYNGKLD